MPSKRIYRGFTLIELLVVIAIIAVLAAILFPVFAKAREKARQSTCINNQRQLAVAISMFTEDNKETFFTDPITQPWSSRIQNYISANGCFTCPSKANMKGSASAPMYGFNSYIYGSPLSNLPNPASVIMTADLNTKTTAANCSLINYDTDLDPRHDGLVILSCADGHVASISQAKYKTMLCALLNGGYNVAGDSSQIVARLTEGINLNKATPFAGTMPADILWNGQGTPPSYKIEFDYYYGWVSQSSSWGAVIFYDDGAVTSVPGNIPSFGMAFGCDYNGNTFNESISSITCPAAYKTSLSKIASRDNAAGAPNYTDFNHFTVYLLKGNLVITKIATPKNTVGAPVTTVWMAQNTNFANLMKQTTDPTHPRIYRIWSNQWASTTDLQYGIYVKNIRFYQL